MKTFTRIIVLLLMSWISLSAYALPKLSSYSGASATIYLDFDGHRVSSAVWNGGTPLNCAPATLTDIQITEIFNRVSEDYRPFNINITTDSTVFLAAPLTQRIRIIVTPTSAWKPGVGGISYIGSFTWGDDTPGFVFTDRLGPNNSKYIAECCTHESGHTLGLSHQSTYDNNCNLVETYCTGSGSGEIGWAPVMGNSYYKNMTGWNDGPTPYGCASVQDNLTTITSVNGFTYRTDDYSGTIDNTAQGVSNLGFILDGIISTSTDKDAFTFTLSQNTVFQLDAKPFSIDGNNTGANLDIKVTLYDAGGNVLRTYDPANSMRVTFDTSLAPGQYYFTVDGSGNQNTDSYGSLGSYKITGVMGSLPIHDVRLSGRVENGRHNLQWNIISDETITEQVLESSADGRTFQPIATVSNNRYQFTPTRSGVVYYRLKVTSAAHQTVLSNVISLKAGNEKNYRLTTLVNNEINIQSFIQYQYRLTDLNGRILKTGTIPAGAQTIPVTSLSSGMYVLQLMDQNTLYAERIIKQ